jgi:hypothetical protein
MLKEKGSNQEDYLTQFTTSESIIKEMNRLHDTFISVIKDQRYLLFWGEATKRYNQLLDKYHMEFATANPKNFQFEASLLEEACDGMEELGLLERITENKELKKRDISDQDQ